jgi:ketosteroid isomerase-like protein
MCAYPIRTSREDAGAYKALVRRIVRRAFADLSAGNFEHHLTRFAEEATMRVHGASERTRTFVGLAQIRQGFRDLAESPLEGPFEIIDIWVKACPGTPALPWRGRDAFGAPMAPTFRYMV